MTAKPGRIKPVKITGELANGTCFADEQTTIDLTTAV
jgi:hypothetical protein